MQGSAAGAPAAGRPAAQPLHAGGRQGMICRAYACSRKLQKRLLGTVKFLSECIHKTMSVKLASRLNQLWSSMVSSHSIFEKNGLYCYADNRNDLFVGRRHNGEGGQGGGGALPRLEAASGVRDLHQWCDTMQLVHACHIACVQRLPRKVSHQAGHGHLS